MVYWDAEQSSTRSKESTSPTTFHVLPMPAVRSRGISIARFAKGKIVKGWDNWDQLGMLEQIGAYTAPEAVILAKSA